jgi:hypothetical protein
MKVYIVNIETRKGDGNSILGTFSTFEKAQAALKKYCDWIDDIENYTDEFDSNFSKGQIYTEEESIEILERELE